MIRKQPTLSLVSLAALLFGSPAALSADDSFRDCPSCPEMVIVSPGRFIKGSPPGEALAEGTPERDARNETPQSETVIEDRYAVSKFEITRAEFAQFVADEGYAPEWACKTWDFDAGSWGTRDVRYTWKSPGFEQDEDHPVLCVSYTDAKAYVEWLSLRTGKTYRLLTDAEWEYAARAGSQSKRYWGDSRESACDHANVSDLDTAERLGLGPDGLDGHLFNCRDGFALTAPVGSFPPNGFGLHDMLGNAWEWVEGCMRVRSEDGTLAEENCSERLIRGGAWQAHAWYVRSAKRDWAPYFLRSARVGIRVARDL